MLADELVVIDGESSLWAAARPLLDAALRIEQNGDEYSWHGWNKRQVEGLLGALPRHCSLVVGVWEMQEIVVEGETSVERELLSMGVVCEVVDGEVCSIRTFEALASSGLKAIQELEPGFEDAMAIMRAARTQVAPVAWALFTDTLTWNEWVFGVAEEDVEEGDDGEDDDNGDGTSDGVIDKGELLARFAREGRCVLMGSQTAHGH